MGLFGKKKDFWDEVDDPSGEIIETPVLDEDFEEEDIEDDGKFHPTKSAALKAFSRILLFASAIVLAVSGLIVYTYFINGGTMASEPNYYHSTYFGKEYDENVKQLLRMIQSMDGTSMISGSDQEKENLMNEYMTTNGNFSFVVYDSKDNQVIASSEDAVSRIEASYYFMRMDSTDGGCEISLGMNNDALDTTKWKEILTSCSDGYTVYAAVDNEFSSTSDSFYESYQLFKKMNSWFDTAKIAAIAAAVIFVFMLIFSIVATGNVKGYSGIHLSLFDRVFTEIALLLIVAFGGGCGYGAYYIYNKTDMTYAPMITCGLAVLAYIFIIRGYFSMVRRLKAGTFINNMLIYRIFECIGYLPAAPRILLVILVLVLLNGSLIFALFRLDNYVFMDIPIVYILVPVIFVLENICFISWVIRKGNAEYEEDEEETETDDEDAAEPQMGVVGDTKPASELGADLAQAAAIAAAQAPENTDDWQHMDLGIAVDKALDEERALGLEENVPDTVDQTVMLPKEEIESLLSTATVHDSATSFDFIQLNKDVRKLHRAVLKQNGITVTFRVPEKPIVLEMNKEDMWKAISMIYDNLEQYAEPDSRVYAEMYTQNGKLIYIVKNAVKADAVETARVVADSKMELTGGLKVAKQIIEANHGKFVVAMDGNIFKTGILLDMVQQQ